MATIREVAKAANVSITTVSKILSNGSRFSGKSGNKRTRSENSRGTSLSVYRKKKSAPHRLHHVSYL